ncbi:GTP cyclohydrolase [Chryseobacterium lactis]|uniref:GTP cyclohydrolase n=1 Tax=Chryseobacterium lactis TaxID=1241981 RepID=A0A3G6RTU4_CHRLC|nr:YciI family protein [Chryseobacterium lactis]AZA84996.1 GTP cyclohydrolase [Chryseobacterium lactis]AZB05384.1 GTP cyclohydrolase [Chryseobacterium lactis]PNW11533.1 GTP cyclohydrolase [Chryseobacterium lactis]
MFIISLTYKVALENVEQHLPEHNVFLQKYYDSGKFIASGRKEPRSGGIIIANAQSKNEIEQIISEDPFYTHQIADYEITEFIPSKYNDNFKFFINNS